MFCFSFLLILGLGVNACPDAPESTRLQLAVTQALVQFETLTHLAMSDWAYGPSIPPPDPSVFTRRVSLETVGTVQWTDALVAGIRAISEGLLSLGALNSALCVGPNVTLTVGGGVSVLSPPRCDQPAAFSQRVVVAPTDAGATLLVRGDHDASMELALRPMFAAWMSSTDTTQAFVSVSPGSGVLFADEGLFATACGVSPETDKKRPTAAGVLKGPDDDCATLLQWWSSGGDVTSADDLWYSVSTAKVALVGAASMWVSVYARNPAWVVSYASSIDWTSPNLVLHTNVSIPLDVGVLIHNWTLSTGQLSKTWVTLRAWTVHAEGGLVTIDVDLELQLAEDWDERLLEVRLILFSCFSLCQSTTSFFSFFFLLCFFSFFFLSFVAAKQPNLADVDPDT
jgi:hypothetical protein